VSIHTRQSIEKEGNALASKPSPGVTDEVFRLQGVTKSWPGEYGFILNVPELIIRRGEKVALVGFSGCGKSTLLDLLAMVLRPDKAQDFTFFTGKGPGLNVMDAWRRKTLNSLAHVRMMHIGYVLQTGGLFPFLSVRENIGITRRGLGWSLKDDVEKIANRLDIGRHLDKLPGQLSVGERQRVAIARAMAHRPSVVLADEPIASLDPVNAESIMNLFTTLTDEYGLTLIMATHDSVRLGGRGFRQVKFGFGQRPTKGAVQANVFG
jgi:putative ABC transport system ATP-binding protein